MQESEIFHLRAESHNPWHLYAAAVLCDKDGRIAIVKDEDGSFRLPRETVASDDSLVRLIHRLVLAQVGVVPDVKRYLGALVIPFDRFDGTKTEKTVLYFHAPFESPYHGQFTEGASKQEGLQWLSLAEARELLAGQPGSEAEALDRLDA
ncbi:MAG TPA: NUDIX domain-containing protein [Candidatus Paceibacterota bacterium]|nr:NUDIX domain-containing protein [Candidatus Paceibacterota bacterium]